MFKNYEQAAIAHERYIDELYEQMQDEVEEPTVQELETKQLIHYMKAMWCADLDFDEDRFNELMLELHGRFK
jgi:hypothetical protein